MRPASRSRTSRTPTATRSRSGTSDRARPPRPALTGGGAPARRTALRDGWSVAALAFLSAGALLRILYAFPVHKYVADADSLLAPLTAFDILRGELRVFYSGLRLGALESYLHAAAFLVFGPSRFAISLAPLLSGVLALVVFYLFVRELFGREPASLALLFFALPSPAYVAWTYMPNGYAQTMLLCVAVLYFAARLARTGFRPIPTLLLGLAAGLGLWSSLESLMCTIPAALWLLIRRPTLLRTASGARATARSPAARFLLLALAGFAVGAAPWIAFNAAYGLASFRGNFATRPPSGAAEIAANARYFAGTNVPELTVGVDPLGDGRPDRPLQEILRVPAAAVYAASGIFLLALPFLSRRRRARGAEEGEAGAVLLLAMIAAAVGLLFVFSGAGGVRELTVRYALPLYLVLATALGLTVWKLWKWRRIAAIAVALPVIGLNAASWYLPGTPFRAELGELERLDRELVSGLEARGIRWICGNYWVVYPINFLSRERIVGVPFQAHADQYRYDEKVPDEPSRAALVGRNPIFLKTWADKTGLPGRIETIGRGFHLFLLADESRRARELVRLFRDTAPEGH